MHVLRPCRRVQHGLGHVAHLRVFRIEQQPANLLRNGAAPRLPGAAHIKAVAQQPILQQIHLRGFAAAVQPLHRKEAAPQLRRIHAKQRL